METKEANAGLNCRHEYKYYCKEWQANLIKTRVLPLMQIDKNTNNSGSYNIRSLYFDNYDNRGFYENEDGTDPKMKYRIRIYNSSDSSIKLERKVKIYGKTQKNSCRLTREQCDAFISNKPVDIIDSMPQLLKEFIARRQTELMEPKIIVEYSRVPLIYRLGNVRVTFDNDISASRDYEHFFDDDIVRRPILNSGELLVEVKYDEFIPDYLYDALQLGSLRETAFSKYYLCRKFMQGERI